MEKLEILERFTQNCPRRLLNLPNKICDKGLCKVISMLGGRYNQESVNDNECIWYVNDKSSCYCFWKYISKKNFPHVLEDIAWLLCVSINNIKLREAEALGHFGDSFLTYIKATQKDFYNRLSKDKGSVKDLLSAVGKTFETKGIKEERDMV